MIVIAHVTVINPNTLTKEVLRLTSAQDFIYDEYTYEPKISKSASFSQALFSRGTTSGEVTVGISELELINDGSLDYLRKYGFNGQPVEIYLLNEKTDPVDETTLYFKGVSFYAKLTMTSLVLSIMTRMQELDINCTDSTFAGDNQGPEGYEGALSLAGKIKPMLYGRCYNVPLYSLNDSLLIFGCNFDKEGNRKAVSSIWTVRDKGGEILYEGDVADAASLKAAVVSYGKYKSCVAEGMIKLGTVPKGVVTADVYESEGEQSSAPRVVRRMLEDIKGYRAGIDFDTGTLEELHSSNSCPVGIYITSNITLLSAVTELLDSIGGWMAPNGIGYFKFGRIGNLPDLIPVAIIDSDIYKEDSLERVPTGDESRNIPAFKVEIRHSKNWNPIAKSESLESLPVAVRDELAQDIKSAVAKDDSVKTLHSQAVSLVYDTLLMDKKQAGIRLDADEFYTEQVSGAGGSLLIEDTIVIDGGSGTYRIHQDLNTPNEIFRGDFTLQFEVVSGTVTAQILSATDSEGAWGGTVLAAVTASAGSNNSLDFTFSALSGERIKVLFSVTSTTAVIRSLAIYEDNPGLSPAEEAERRLKAQKQLQERYIFELSLPEFKFIQIGECIILQEDRYELSNGKKFLVIGREDDLDEEVISLDVWSYTDDLSE